jgi:hypothetical protein
MTRPNIPVPDELADTRAKIKALEQREAELKQILLANPDVREGANWLAEIQTVTQQRTDLEELRAVHPNLVAEYTFPVKVTSIVLSGISEDGEIVSARKFHQATESRPT